MTTKLEQTLLGYVIEHKSSFAIVTPLIPSLKYWESVAHRKIYTALLDLEEVSEWDQLIIADQLKKTGDLRAAGGYTYLAELSEAAPGNCNIAYYAKLLREKYLSKSVEQHGKLLLQRLAERGELDKPQFELNTIVTETLEELQKIQGSLGAREDKVRNIPEIAATAWTELEQAAKSKTNIGLPTGFDDLDNHFGGGLQRSEFNIIAARPSVGKTSLALNIANNCSPKSKIMFVSIETTGESLVKARLFPLLSGIDSRKFRMPKNMNADDWSGLAETGRITGSYKNFNICDQSSMTISDVELLIASEAKAEGGGIDLLIIDYLQRIKGTRQHRSREREIADISQRLAALIKEHKLFSIILAQLNREAEKLKREPIMSDLRESGQLEQDADTIVFLHQGKDEEGRREGPMTAIFAKNRNGRVGKVDFEFDRSLTKFKEIQQTGYFE